MIVDYEPSLTERTMHVFTFGMFAIADNEQWNIQLNWRPISEWI